MRQAHTSGAHIGRCAGSGHAAAPGTAGLLSLCATPVFALMALWTGLFGQSDAVCMSVHDASRLNGMSLMYALMSVFHTGPWLKLMPSRRIRAHWR
jgi:hypothetical protein